jgi:hypothetical protein
MGENCWDLAISMFRVDWVMPSSVMGLLTCWPRLSKRASVSIWHMLPHCIMWSLWQVRNAQSFEGCEKNIHDSKKFFLYTLMEWAVALGVISCYSLLDFIELCSFTL